MFFLLPALFIRPAAAAGENGLQPLSFLPQWSPQAQFVGYYLALHKGFYRKHGIDLTIIEGGPSRSAMEYLQAGKADIVTLWLSSALQLADRGVEVINVGQVVQRSALMLVAKKKSGIETPAQMNGKKIGLWPADFQVQPRAFFDKFKLKVRVVTTESPVNLFLRDGVQVSSVMWYNEYHTLLSSGLDPEEMTLFFFHDSDLNFPEDGLYMRKEVFAKNPEAACAFTAASLEGWRYAFDHPEEALDLIVAIMEKAYIPANRVHQRWMLNRMRDVIAPSGAAGWGVLQAENYRRVGEILVSFGLIQSVPPYESFFWKCPGHDQK
jgi:NitT/TauT family transport system substrate-binding protein